MSINGMAVNERHLLENWGEDHPPHDEVEEGRILKIPLGYESWFIPTVVRPSISEPVVVVEPVVMAVPEPGPWEAWAAGLTELLNTLAPVAVGILAIMLLGALKEE